MQSLGLSTHRRRLPINPAIKVTLRLKAGINIFSSQYQQDTGKIAFRTQGLNLEAVVTVTSRGHRCIVSMSRRSHERGEVPGASIAETSSR
ncbi:hypothetical protein FOCG_05433 [Fusarium oxysporum f. sp. radicis-lycopersici 26381]|uniref:Uncharacterized protein n=3 Tax=Fusarium oxysporum TaxID=5507 RepID=A0A0J9VW30_FUSO4|nr:hypothetical protein FOXG_21234 [Fusarium oxysporum f. sp. lycopersici 4287]EWZ30085.1 hypothetical protein FOZG_16267 [Fusarium oxysporum Fo47]EWZ96970.1 hypothetical protein FOWG_04186 [Fusarium oxysporum f. sp. lycopersici MN25]EXK34704.1 hypothetical protein FOMG_10074 [Fusarium oxysporum f. sp. melonis 26406]EXL54580.1 hypothetical protein FOCG_05433 [Fusarium oxysporum f. sp. radicis-lycopersici 26381]KAJ0156679.1 Uncharacterized protein HZ326_1167 [Fusarium oxysporum f. sp. albedinis